MTTDQAVQTLPPGVYKNDYGLFVRDIPTGRQSDGEDATKQREVIIHPDPEEGRQIANKRDADYWDETTQLFIYRGVKPNYEGPEPPRRPDLYVMDYPGYREFKEPEPIGRQLSTGNARKVASYPTQASVEAEREETKVKRARAKATKPKVEVDEEDEEDD